MAYTSGELSRQVAEGPSVIKPWSLAVARAPSKDVPATTTTTGSLENEQVPSNKNRGKLSIGGKSNLKGGN